MKKLLALASLLLLGGLLGFSGASTCGGTASAAATTAAEGGWVLLTSNRDGKERTYSVGVNGERLTPLFAAGPRLVSVAVSRNGGAIAYFSGRHAPDFGPLYLSRADGTGLRRVAQRTGDLDGPPTFSPNGKLLAFSGKRGIWIVGSDGRGLRRLTKKDDQAFDWSPDGKALVLLRVISKDIYGGGRYAVVVQPLRGKRRLLVRTGPHEDDWTYGYQPQWSPNGRWIAYINHEDNRRRQGLTLVRPNGTRRHRVTNGADEEESFEWSPDGRWIAYRSFLDLLYVRPRDRKSVV